MSSSLQNTVRSFLYSMIHDRKRSADSQKEWHDKGCKHAAIDPPTALSRLDRDQAFRMATIYGAEVDVLNRTIVDYRETFIDELEGA